MNVRMFEFLVPGMKDTEEADLRAEMLGVASDLQQRVGASPEEQGIDLAFVLHRQRRKVPRHCEDHVDVAGGQQFFPPRFEPAIACIGLTFWAVPVAAGVV